MSTRRLALVLGASFPAPRGSQHFFSDQACALQEAGCDVTVFVHGHGDGRDCSELSIRRASHRVSPTGLGSELSARRLLAHVSLAGVLFREHRRKPFDAIIAHNVEAAGIALALRPLLRRPVLYVAHTLWERELSAYLPETMTWLATRVGRLLDREASRRADATQALTEAAARRLREENSRPVRAIPPSRTFGPAPEDAAEVCAQHGLEPGGYVVYAGNADQYQNLQLLNDAAQTFREVPVVVASQDPPDTRLAHLRWARVATPEEARQLVFAAGLVAVPRRLLGGFPIKLLEAMEAARAILCLEGMTDGLRHGESAWLLPRSCSAADFAAALEHLWHDAKLRGQLGANAREQLAASHDPKLHAAALLDLLPLRP